MRFLFINFRKYPWQTLAMLTALLLAGVAEGIGLSALLPLLSIALGDEVAGGSISSAGSGKSATAADQLIRDVFATFGLTPTLELLMGLILAAILLKAVLVWVANRRVGYTVARLTTDLRHQVLQAFLLARWEFHLSQPVGKLAAVIGGETARTARAYAAGVAMIIAVIHAMIYVGVAFLVSWKATLIALAAGLFFWYPLNRFVKKSKRAGALQTKLMKSLSAQFVDNLQSIKPLKAMARENRAESVLIAKTDQLKKALKKQVISKESLKAFQESIRVTFLLACLYVAFVIWQMPVSMVLVLIVLLGRVLTQLNKVQVQFQQMGLLESAYWSMTDTLKLAETAREPKLGNQKPKLKHAIHLESVTFDYSGKSILKNASLNFPAGMLCAIIGPSGAGKTTIVDLVIGLLRPKNGDVWIDDMPMAQVDLQSWRRMIGYVPQDTILLHDSIFMNVSLGDPKISVSDVEEALRKAEVWEFVDNMPDRMRRIVGERGSKLSGGQRQRIAIARALVHKPKLLILDEATTALDPENEAAICETLRRLRGELTILAISHQSAILDVADRAYRMEDGKAILVPDLLTNGKAEVDTSAATV
jgi:ATP-binding cassette subfamily C protein